MTETVGATVLALAIGGVVGIATTFINRLFDHLDKKSWHSVLTPELISQIVAFAASLRQGDAEAIETDDPGATGAAG